MPKEPQALAKKIQEIFDLAHGSETPVSVLSVQTAMLLGSPDWSAEEVERVSGEVLDMLIRRGWKKSSA